MTGAALQELAALMQQFGLDILEIEQPGQQLRLVMHHAAGATPAAAVTIGAPIPGILRRTHPDGAFPPCAAGATVQAGQILAFVQSGLLLTPVLAQAAGRLTAWLLAEGDVAGAGTALCSLALAQAKA